MKLNLAKVLEIISVIAENAPAVVSTGASMAAWITKGMEAVHEAYGDSDPSIDKIKLLIGKIRERENQIQAIK